jgi:hypothetical protein
MREMEEKKRTDATVIIMLKNISLGLVVSTFSVMAITTLNYFLPSAADLSFVITLSSISLGSYIGFKTYHEILKQK